MKNWTWLCWLIGHRWRGRERLTPTEAAPDYLAELLSGLRVTRSHCARCGSEMVRVDS